MIIEITGLQAADCKRVEPRLRRCVDPLIIRGTVAFDYVHGSGGMRPSAKLRVNGDALHKHSSIVETALNGELGVMFPPESPPTRRQRLGQLREVIVAFVRG